VIWECVVLRRSCVLARHRRRGFVAGGKELGRRRQAKNLLSPNHASLPAAGQRAAWAAHKVQCRAGAPAVPSGGSAPKQAGSGAPAAGLASGSGGGGGAASSEPGGRDGPGQADPERMSVRELRQALAACGDSGEGCIERADLVERLRARMGRR
jgi:hypothetical protein